MEFIEDEVGAEHCASIEVSERRTKSIGDRQETAQRLVNGGEKQI